MLQFEHVGHQGILILHIKALQLSIGFSFTLRPSLALPCLGLGNVNGQA